MKQFFIATIAIIFFIYFVAGLMTLSEYLTKNKNCHTTNFNNHLIQICDE
jgi:hypothetical protein